MDLLTYQEKSQATVRLPDTEYFLLGMLGEVGELAEKTKKVIRDKQGVIDAETRHLLLLECGDVAWYLSQFTTAKGLSLFGHEYTIMSVDSLQSAVLDLGKAIGTVLYAHDGLDIQFLKYPISVAVSRLEIVCILLESSLEEVLDMNIEKLMSRKQRGVIHGEGDVR